MAGDPTVYEEWATFLDEIYAFGRTDITAERAQAMFGRLQTNLLRTEHALTVEKGIYIQTHMQNKRQALALMQELERFVRTRAAPHPGGQSGKSGDLLLMYPLALTSFMDDHVHGVYQVVLWSFWQPLAHLEGSVWGLKKTRGRAPNLLVMRERALQEIGELYDRFSADMPKLRVAYEQLKRDTKAQLPEHFHRLIDMVVELFVYEPYELGLLYIRRHLSGAVGAFHGLDP